MKKLYVALITPFTIMNDIDYPALDKIILRLLDENVEGFIVCGTTGESPTCSENEKIALLEHVIHLCERRCEIYFGIGSSNTCDSMRLLKLSEDMDFDGYLIVTPYYNQPTQFGLYEHFSTLATETKKKIILYNVPSRCGVSLSAATVIKLANDYKNIVALKQASKDLEMVKEILNTTTDFEVLSGNDDYLLEGMMSGMSGVVSVIAHFTATKMKEFFKGIEEGRDVSELDIFFKKLAHLCFLESNPICIKYLLSQQNECENVLRLPMTAISYEAKTKIDQNYDKIF
ncbi:4-hydroxy-tetrahydrodipicolinate synthase [Traorella massiliensis]|uniref:4-hydroxy-tetrahydrodipicolinate synthase n=1 Tax=Traorella massiliensis TaxID=1903263 RepID=UPI002353AD28|nr:4-hydroxy-tetrahydrodipicolinate synthase [Traorella massiliensis]